ncbi:MAG: VCBS repeat-containing protein [Candidatus Saccharibacteria bacterium]|nr:VCBS repeat-containing protein [Candidatus Saccharibacteria bacterium]
MFQKKRTTKTSKTKSSKTRKRAPAKKTRKGLLKNHKGFIPLRGKSRKSKKIKFGSKTSKKTKMLGLAGVLAFGAVGSYLLFFSSAQVANSKVYKNGVLTKIDPSGHTITNTASDGTTFGRVELPGLIGYAWDLSWSNDGRRLAVFTKTESGHDAMVFIYGGDYTLENSFTIPRGDDYNSVGIGSIQWNSNGDQLLIGLRSIGSGIESYEAIIANKEGNITYRNKLQQNDHTTYRSVTWIDQGNKIAYFGTGGIRTMFIDGSADQLEVPTSQIPTALESPEVFQNRISLMRSSRTGDDVAFIFNNNVFVMDTKDFEIEQVSFSDNATSDKLTWSPDGKLINYSRRLEVSPNASSQVINLSKGTDEAFGGPFSAGHSWRPISNTSQQVDFNGDGFSDIFFYEPGSAKDSVWYGSDGMSSKRPATLGQFDVINSDNTPSINVIGTSYKPIHGDFNGDGYTDIFWYGPGSTNDSIWYGGAGDGEFTRHTAVNVAGSNYNPVAGDFNGDGFSDIYFYAPGGTTDYIWYGQNNKDGNFDSKQKNISGDYKPVSGDFNGDGYGDILWYAPGQAADYVWYGSGQKNNFTSRPISVNVSAYEPFGGDFNGDGFSDIYFYAPGGTTDYIWYGKNNKTGNFDSKQKNVRGDYRPASGDFNSDGYTDIFWYGPGSTNDSIWYGGPGDVQFELFTDVNVGGDAKPIPGR